MTDPNVHPADETPGDQTIPLIPDGRYAATEQWPFPEETLVDPSAGNPWAASTSPEPPAPGYGSGLTDSPTSRTPSAPRSNYTQPQVAYSQQPTPQPDHYRQAGFAEPAGPGDGRGPQNTYQGYPGLAYGQQQPAWPAVIQDPVSFDYGYSRPPAASEHPNAIISMVLGIVGLAFFWLLSPVAWFLAAKARREMAAYPGRWRPSGALTAGFVLGIIGTVLLGFAAAFTMLMVFILVASS